MTQRHRRRRTLLRAAGSLSLAGLLAGCTDGDSSETERSPSESGGATETDGGDPTVTDPPGQTPTDTATLDLREANVVGVDTDTRGESIRFDVALHHDDDGEDGYADWWEVQRPDGTRLGRRELSHPHSRQPFTRSETIAIPADVDCVVVRGHDQTHGYGGRAVLVNLHSGAKRGVRQGPDPTAFAAGDCP